METSTHTAELVRIHEKILKESPAEGRYIDIAAGQKIYVIEAGAGPPVVILHGTGAAALTMAPLLEHFEGVRTIFPDLPGAGLSDPVDSDHNAYHDMAVEGTGQMLDALGVEQVSLAGSSGGGVWAIWYALTHPERIERLILLGSAPLLPGTQPPLPLRIMTAPIIGDIITRMPANESTVLQIMGIMGEKETIVNHPQIIEALVASNNDPLASQTARTEFAAFFNLRGFRPNMKIRQDDLAKLGMPTLVIWGDHDPLGGEDVARGVCEAIPNCELAILPAGHVPYLGCPEEAAKRIQDFVLSS